MHTSGALVGFTVKEGMLHYNIINTRVGFCIKMTLAPASRMDRQREKTSRTDAE